MASARPPDDLGDPSSSKKESKIVKLKLNYPSALRPGGTDFDTVFNIQKDSDGKTALGSTPDTPLQSEANPSNLPSGDDDSEAESADEDDLFGQPIHLPIAASMATVIDKPVPEDTEEYRQLVTDMQKHTPEDPHRDPNGTPNQSLHTYTQSPGRVAALVGMPLHELYGFLLRNTTMLEIYPLLESLSLPDDVSKQRGVGFDKYLRLYNADPEKYDHPNKTDLENFDTAEQMTHIAARCKNALGREKAFGSTTVLIANDAKFQWGLVMTFYLQNNLMKKTDWWAYLKKLEAKKARTFQGHGGAGMDLVERDRVRRQQINAEAQAMKKIDKSQVAGKSGTRKGQSGDTKGKGKAKPAENLPNFQPPLDDNLSLDQLVLTKPDNDSFMTDVPMRDMSDSAIYQRFEAIRLQKEEERKRMETQMDIAARADALKTRQNMLALHEDTARHQGFQDILWALKSYTVNFFHDFDHVEFAKLKDMALEVFKKYEGCDKWTFRDYLDLDQVATAAASNGTRDIEPGTEDIQDAMVQARAQDLVHVEETRKSSRLQAKSRVADTDFLSMPQIREQNKQAMELMDWLMGGPSFQYDDMKGAVNYANITDMKYLRLPGQSSAYTLNWWQILVPAWACLVMQKHLTRGGIVADFIGLGKTIEYIALLLVDLFHTQNAYHDAPAGKKPPCRPCIIFTLPSLVAQTADEVARFGKIFNVVVVHANPGILDAPGNLRTVKSLAPSDPIFRTDLFSNLNTVVVTSPDTWASQNGPRSMERFLDAKGITDFKLQDTDGYYRHYNDWSSTMRGLFRVAIVDEVQNDFRNPNSFYAAVDYLQAPKIFLFSGSLAPKGLKDFAAYLGLLSLPELEKEAKKHFTQKKLPLLKYPGHEPFRPGDDPYILPYAHPARKFCFTRTYYTAHISDLVKHDLDNATLVRLGQKAQPVLSEFIIRRTYKSAYPIGSANTIGSAMQPLYHFEEDLIFCPTGQELYDAAIVPWGPRMMATSNDPNNKGELMPNPRAARAITWLSHCPWIKFLHKPNPNYKPRKRKSDDDDDDDDDDYEYENIKAKPTEQNEVDWHSIFWEGSELYQNLLKQGPNIVSGESRNLPRWRWLIYQTVTCDEYAELPKALWTTTFVHNDKKQNWRPDDLLDPNKVPNRVILQMVLKYSPKLNCLLSHILSIVLQKDKKVLLWFQWPIIQALYLEVVESIPGCAGRIAQITAETSALERSKIQKEINNKYSEKRIFLIGTRIGGTGMNFQLDCCNSIIVDPCETLDKEDQVIGRIHRFGQKCHCWVYSLKLSNTSDERIIEKALNRSLATTTALLSRSARTAGAEAPEAPAATRAQDDDSDSNTETEDEGDQSPLPEQLDDISPFLHRPLYKDPLQGWFTEYNNEEVRLHQITTKQGWAIMRSRIEEGLVDGNAIRKHLLAPDVALSWIKKNSRAQTYTQHGGVGITATRNLEGMRLQEVFLRREYALKLKSWKQERASALAQGKPFTTKKPRKARESVPSEDSPMWTPSATQYWDIWPKEVRKQFREAVEKVFANLGITERWKPPKQTKTYREKRAREGPKPKSTPKKGGNTAQKRKQASQNTSGEGSSRKRQKKDPQTPTKQSLSAEFVDPRDDADVEDDTNPENDANPADAEVVDNMETEKEGSDPPPRRGHSYHERKARLRNRSA